jgi:L-iditol 2-dehydrogenase
MTNTMQAAVYYNNHDIRIEEMPIPEIGPDEVLVKTIASGICGGELMEWYHAPRAPKVMGHEPAGIIVEKGPQVKNFNVGDRIFVNHYVSCGTCRQCLRGRFTQCEHLKESKLYPGTTSQYFRVPSRQLNRDTLLIPDNVSFAEATVCEPWGCVIGGLKVTEILPGDTVLVIGAGFMGLGFIHMAPLFGAGKVIAMDLSDWRLNKSLSMGATHTINPSTENVEEKLRDLNGGYLADVVIVTVPTVALYTQGHNLVEKGGFLHLGAPTMPEPLWQINPQRQYFTEMKISSKYSADHNDTSQIMKWLAAGRIDVLSAITHRVELKDTLSAFMMMVEAGESLKTIVYPHGIDQEIHPGKNI